MLLIYQTLKIALGVLVSILIATYLNLDYALSAGIVTLLSLFDIKRKTILLGIQRFYTSMIAFVIAILAFTLFGFNLFGFFVYLVLFIPICIRMEARAGIVVNTVLVSHIYQNGLISIPTVMNELLLLSIGIILAWGFHLHTPNMEKTVRGLMIEVENNLKDVLRMMGNQLKDYCEINQKIVTLEDFEKSIRIGLERANYYQSSYYLKDNSYYVAYFEMRLRQYERLQYMSEHLDPILVAKKEAEIIIQFTDHIADLIHEFNSGELLIQELQALLLYFKESELPKTREEFENRAMLYQYLNDLEAFVRIKLEFAIKYKNTGANRFNFE